MKILLVVAALAVAVLSVPASAEKPQDKPYAAGSPYGGIPLWNPGDKFVAVSGGGCSGTCPIYEVYVFSDGRVVFSGRKYTGKIGVFRKQLEPSVYTELVTYLVRSGVLETDLKRGTCLKDRPTLLVMRSNPDGQSVRTQTLNSGCEKQSDLATEIEKEFISWTEIDSWLAAK